MGRHSYTVYIADTAGLPAGLIESMKTALPRARREGADRLKSPAGRAESVAAAYLAYFALCGEIDKGVVYPAAAALLEGIPRVAALAAEIGWTVGRHGKPFPSGIDRSGERIYISISHSRGIAAAAAANLPIGIDVQCIPSMTAGQIKRVASKFHPCEYERLMSVPESGLAAEFCRIWACKESVMKLCGRGLALPMSSFCIGDEDCILDGKPVKINAHPLRQGFLAIAQWA